MNKPLEGKRMLAVIYGTELFGSERANLEALQSMQRMGATILVGVSAREPEGGDVGDFARNAGFETFLLPFGSHFAYSWMRHDRAYRNRQLKRLWTNSRALHRAIKQFRPTHLMFSTVLSSIFVALALVWHRTPLIYRIGDAPVVESKFQLFFWRRLIRRATHIVCVSDFIKDQVLNHSPKKPHDVSTIYNVPITRGNALNEAQLSSLRENKKPFQLVFVGQITEQKGIVELVKALIQMNDGNIGAWIVGGGAHSLELENELQAMVLASETRTCIEFFGYQSDPRPFYAAADWHIAPSTYEEPMANTTFEAKIGAIPSIVSNLGGFPEVIQHKYDGWILPEANAIQIQKCFNEIIQLESDWVLMGERARESIQVKYNHQTFDNKWRRVITL